MKITITDIYIEEESENFVKIRVCFSAVSKNFQYANHAAFFFRKNKITDTEITAMLETLTRQVWIVYSSWKECKDKKIVDKYPRLKELIGKEIPKSYWLKHVLLG